MADLNSTSETKSCYSRANFFFRVDTAVAQRLKLGLSSWQRPLTCAVLLMIRTFSEDRETWLLLCDSWLAAFFRWSCVTPWWARCNFRARATPSWRGWTANWTWTWQSHTWGSCWRRAKCGTTKRRWTLTRTPRSPWKSCPSWNNCPPWRYLGPPSIVHLYVVTVWSVVGGEKFPEGFDTAEICISRTSPLLVSGRRHGLASRWKSRELFISSASSVFLSHYLCRGKCI